MRIAVDCRSLQEPQPSGVSWYTFYQLKALIDASPEHDFELLVVRSRHVDDSQLYIRAQKEWTNANVHWRVLPYPKRLLTLLLTLGVWRSWTRLFGVCDAVWLPNLHFVPRTRSASPVVLTMHDVSYERYPQYLPLKGRAWHRILRPILFQASRLVCVSTHTAQEVTRVYHIPDDRCVVVYPGVSSHLISRVQHPIPTVLCVSTIEPRKNIDALVLAMKHVRATLSAVRCVVVGKKGFHAQQTIDHMRAAGIEYRGYVTSAEKEHLMRETDVMVYPSIYEGFGLPPLEAQAQGIPVIAGNNTSLPEVLGESAVLCDVNDARALAVAIISVLSDTALAQRVHSRGLLNAQRFSWEKSAHILKQLFASL